MKAKKHFVYDDEELEILRAFEENRVEDAPMSEKETEAYRQNAAYTKALREKRQTTIRFSVADLAVVKARAKEMGIGYQNLIQALVHNYATGKLKLE